MIDKNNPPKQCLPKIYNLELIEKIKEDYLINKLGTEEIVKKYKTSLNTLNRNLMYYNIPLREKYKNSNPSHRRLILNNNFLNYDNKEVQYWLGFLCADGSIYQDRLALGLAKKDEDVLIKFNTFLGNKLTIKNVIHHKKYPQVKLQFRNKEVISTLDSYGITNNKSITLDYKLPITWDFLRGVIDGDGCISYTEKRIRIELVSGSELFINKISKFLNDNNITHGLYKLNRKNTIYNIQVFKLSSIENLLIKLYTNADIYLNRKYQNAVKIRNYFDNKRLNSGNQH